MSLFDALLRVSDVGPTPGIGDWWRREVARTERSTAALALLGGHAADRLAWAFASGYRAALLRVAPGAPRDRRLALCATEAGGAHPREMNTRLARDGDTWRLDGEKGFVTMGSFAERLLTIASCGEDGDGRKVLRAVWVDADADGVTIEDLPALPMVPEIPHAVVRFVGARVGGGAILAEDAWIGLVKPFRTVEDIHVHAALTGWLLRLSAAHRWPESARERLLAHTHTLCGLAEAPPDDAATHLALAGALTSGQALLTELEPCWRLVDPDTREMWERDRGLLRVASKAREARREAAWRRIP